MARQRMINPSIWVDEGMAELTLRQQLLYIGLFSNADDAGRLKRSLSGIRLMLPTVYPRATNEDVAEDLLCVLSAMTKLIAYEVENRSYLAFINYATWQKISHPTPSRLPPPPPGTREDSAASPDDRHVGVNPPGGFTEDSRRIPPQVNVVKLSTDQDSLEETPTGVAPPGGGVRLSATASPDETAVLLTTETDPATPPPALPRAAPKPTTLNRAQLLRFDRWYAAYPNKQHRPEAEKAWRKIDPDDALTDRMVGDLAARLLGRKWSDRFIEYPATYLSRRVWEDDIEPVNPVRGSPRPTRAERNARVTEDWYPGKSLGLPPPEGATDADGHAEGRDEPPVRRLRSGPD